MYPSIHPNKMFLLNFSLFSVSNVIDTGEIGLIVEILFFGTIKYSLYLYNWIQRTVLTHKYLYIYEQWMYQCCVYNWIESTFGDKDKHIGAGF